MTHPEPLLTPQQIGELKKTVFRILAFIIVGFLAWLWWQRRDEESERPIASRDVLKEAASNALGRDFRGAKIDMIHSGQFAGSFSILIQFQARPALTNAMLRSEVRLQMVKAYQAVWDTQIPVASVSCEAVGGLTDQFGKEIVETLFHTSMNSETASKVVWRNADRINFDLVWLIVSAHPVMVDM